MFSCAALDLVPSNVVAGWVKYLRREFPTIAFRASTQQQKLQSRQDKTKGDAVGCESEEAKGSSVRSLPSPLSLPLSVPLPLPLSLSVPLSLPLSPSLLDRSALVTLDVR